MADWSTSGRTTSIYLPFNFKDMAWEKYSAKKDENHNEIADVFRDAGYIVKDTHQIKGFVDFIAANERNTLFVEVKSKYGRLSKMEEAFHKEWKQPVYTIRTTDEAREVIKERSFNRQVLRDLSRYETVGDVPRVQDIEEIELFKAKDT